jgi:hypothetical protein
LQQVPPPSHRLFFIILVALRLKSSISHTLANWVNLSVLFFQMRGGETRVKLSIILYYKEHDTGNEARVGLSGQICLPSHRNRFEHNSSLYIALLPPRIEDKKSRQPRKLSSAEVVGSNPTRSTTSNLVNYGIGKLDFAKQLALGSTPIKWNVLA